ncbi:MotA/TolQ/ExbB proton channel family protein [Halopseudomonas pelagia]|uniref:MotA/TolQ/ExbB proton channel family protein n=1 Tax=Halopseudomonas pelagia TaxID=553151 RepID=UPI0030D6FDAE|tara:strand:- start:525 stop:1403 length:879 start_codon:yes stop_codon:yes gene_type:complete
MDMRSLGFHSSRWQSRLRLAALLVFMGLAGMTASLVMAQTPSEEATPAEVERSVISEPVAGPVASVIPVATERFGVREMFVQADMVVKGVMIFLVLCSLLTWAVLIEKLIVFARARRANQRFLEAFRQQDVGVLQEQAEQSSMGRMWQVAQAEVTHFGRHRQADADQINRLLQRMSLTASIVQERDLARLGSMMGVLATIGATAPFIGLFGTVWGILNSFASIATMKTASLAIVAPGIAEALLATALGLFAAIPAVMIFNKFARDINGFVGGLDNFSAEMIADVSRKLDEVK